MIEAGLPTGSKWTPPLPDGTLDAWQGNPRRCPETVIPSARRTRLALVRTLSALALPLLVLAAGAVRAAFDEEEAFARSQAAIGVLLDDHRFVDTRGQPVGLGDLRRRPLVMSLVYTSCPDTCNIVTHNLARVVREARRVLGEESFTVATVGFDHRFDTPEQMRLYADRQGVEMEEWHFLSGDADTLERLLEQVGFSYVESPRGYDHLAQVSVIDASGRVYRQIYGDAFTVRSLVEPLKELALGRAAAASELGDWIERVKLICTVYDPNSGRYRFDYSIFVAAGVGLLCLGGIAVFIVRAWRDQGPPGRGA